MEKLILGGALASVPQANAGQMRLIAEMPNGAGKRLHALEAAHQEARPSTEAHELFYKLHVCRADPLPPDARPRSTSRQVDRLRVMNGPNEFTIVGVIKDWDRRKDLGRIKVPTLITTGEYDEVTLDATRPSTRGSRAHSWRSSRTAPT